MSDAKGENDDPTTGEPIEAAAGEETGAARAGAADDAAAQEAAADDATRAVPMADAPDDATRAVPTADAADDATRAVPTAGDDAPTGAADDAAGAAAGAAAPFDAARKEPAPETATYALDDADAPHAEGARAEGEAGGIAGEPAEDAPAAEVDYAALAAELEEFEARQAGAAGAAPAAHAAEERNSSGWFDPAPDTFRATEPGEDSPTEVIAPPGAPDAGETAVLPQAGDQSETAVITPSEPTAQTTVAAAGAGAGSAAAGASDGPHSDAIFETFEPPRKRGNRVAALLIGVPATIVFALLYAAVDLLYGWFQNDVQVETLVDDLVPRILEFSFWVPVAVFFLAFWLVGVIVNRGRAGWWVVLGFVVAAVTYLGFVFAPVIAYPFWLMTPSDASAAVEALLLNPVAIGVFIIAREVTVWFGAWAAGRGRRMKRLNAEDKAEYDKAVAEAE
ncbi:hypothetical protein [Microbacterium halophytorum]|uniref:hypothetical protein n=1 Tax=Microbacterium halophytorum TaxID=2067568 RepID=UPI000CFDE725|nr:hypothetical protein [Microbacterium halophytorum]